MGLQVGAGPPRAEVCEHPVAVHDLEIIDRRLTVHSMASTRSSMALR